MWILKVMVLGAFVALWDYAVSGWNAKARARMLVEGKDRPLTRQAVAFLCLDLPIALVLLASSSPWLTLLIVAAFVSIRLLAARASAELMAEMRLTGLHSVVVALSVGVIAVNLFHISVR